MKLKVVLTDILPSIMRYRLARLGIGKPGRPINITLSVTNMCQSRCKTCNIWEMYRGNCGQSYGGIGDEMTLEDYERLFRDIGHVYFVNISGGEPFLRKDLPDIIELANRLLTPGVIHTPTNAIMTDRIVDMTEDILRRLGASGRNVVFTVKPSFDGVGKRHDEIRGVPGNFERLIETLARLKQLKNRYPHLEVGAGTVISKLNHRDVREIAEYVHSLKLDSYISEIAEQRSEMFNTNDPITPSVEEYEEAIRAFSEMSRKNLRSAGNIGRTTGKFRLVYYDLVVKTLRIQRQVLPCYAGISNVHISPYGDVWPCCVLGYDKSFGRLGVDGDFWQIWNSPKACEVRRSIKGRDCWCPLANQAYSNMLISPITLARVALSMTARRRPEARQVQ